MFTDPALETVSRNGRANIAWYRPADSKSLRFLFPNVTSENPGPITDRSAMLFDFFEIRTVFESVCALTICHQPPQLDVCDLFYGDEPTLVGHLSSPYGHEIRELFFVSYDWVDTFFSLLRLHFNDLSGLMIKSSGIKP